MKYMMEEIVIWEDGEMIFEVISLDSLNIIILVIFMNCCNFFSF